MYSIKLAWHSHNIDLPAVEAYVKANFPNCIGNSADVALTFWFTEALSTEQEQNLMSYWAGRSALSVEAISYVSNAAIMEAIRVMKIGLLLKTWDLMTAAERKIVLGQNLSKAELGL
jgi:hypothetical protein